MGFSRQEYWVGCHALLQRNLPDLVTEPGSLMSPALAGRFFTIRSTWEAHQPRKGCREPCQGAGSSPGLVSKRDPRASPGQACDGRGWEGGWGHILLSWRSHPQSSHWPGRRVQSWVLSRCQKSCCLFQEVEPHTYALGGNVFLDPSEPLCAEAANKNASHHITV